MRWDTKGGGGIGTSRNQEIGTSDNRNSGIAVIAVIADIADIADIGGNKPIHPKGR